MHSRRGCKAGSRCSQRPACDLHSDRQTSHDTLQEVQDGVQELSQDAGMPATASVQHIQLTVNSRHAAYAAASMHTVQLTLVCCAVVQDVQDAVGELGQEMSLQVPPHVTAQSNESSPVYSTIVDAALRPVKYIPETAAVKVSPAF